MAISTVSFNNTPQATGDMFYYDALVREGFSYIYLDVMANDLGGKAKTLYSLDDGMLDGSVATAADIQAALLTQLTHPTISAYGASIEIKWDSTDGKFKVAYDASALQHNLDYQQLSATDYLTDSFTYAIRLGNGTLSWATATVKILGVNDAPVIDAAGSDTSADLTETNAPLSTSGTLLFSDIDSGDTPATSYTDSTISAVGIALSADQQAAIADAFSIDADGNWSFDLASPDYLAASDVVTAVFTVTVTDDQGATATQDVTITITGTNDAPVVDLNTGTVGLNNTATFTEVSGADTGANAVFFSAGGTNISDVDSANLANLKVSLSAVSAATGDRLVFGGTVIDITGTTAMGEVTAGGTVFRYAIADVSGTRTITFTSLSGSGGSATEAPKASYEALLDGLKYNNTSDTPVDGSTRVFSVTVNDGTMNSAAATFTVTLVAVADDTTPPTAIITGSSSKDVTAGTATFAVVFSESVTGVDASDFVLTGTAFTAPPNPTITNVTGSGANYTVTVSYVSAPPANGGDRGNSLTLTLKTGTNVVDAAGNVALTASGTINSLAPAGTAGEPINLALTDPSDHVGAVTVSISGVPTGWTFNAGTNNGDGTWTVLTNNPSALTVTTPADHVGAMVLSVSMSWTNADGSTENMFIANNVEAYAPGNPIFALSIDDNLTGSSGADLFVFAQPIGNNVIHSFDAAADKIDLIGFAGVTGFADLSIANDANGNALVSIGSGQTITIKGVDAAALGAANFLFDVDPLTTNSGTISIADGAIMPFGGSIHNSGSIELGSTGSETALEILFRGANLTGGGQVLLSDSAQNVIFGGSADTVLTNVDNRISGAGQLGAGQLVLINAGLILASGANALVIDTGDNTIVNSGTLESTGAGGMTVASAIDNSGHLWANGSDLRLLADVTGNGSATIDGNATLSFAGAAHASVAFYGGGAGTLVIAQAEAAGSLVGILGLESDDSLVFGDLAFGANTQLSYSTNAYGSGGVLTVDDGTQRAEVSLLGHYSAADFQVAAGGEAGTLVSYSGAHSGTLVGSMLADVLSGGSGNDILAGRGGADTLSGGAGADVFAYLNLGDGGDSILDYSFAEGDALDLSALLDANFVTGSSQVSDFVQLVQAGSDITVQVDTDGATNGTNFADVAVLSNYGTPAMDMVRIYFGDSDHTLSV
ncbi:beta strand repeat-containing protein [Pseudomonas sp.]|uniref:beta strand repeat-containing protein n=1 Tax=Pseudomonas sp. TaxID=306 RepID=UPI003BB529C2